MVVGLKPGEHSLRVRINFDGDVFEVENLVTIVSRDDGMGRTEGKPDGLK